MYGICFGYDKDPNAISIHVAIADQYYLFPGTFELMQYTGVKDKNGKEIYEGDIISYKYYRAVKRFWSSLEEIPIIEAEVEAQKNDISFQTSIVIFEDGIFRLEEPFDLTLKDVSKNEKYQKNGVYRADIETKSWHFEVIGNIHENPELLEQKR